MKTILIRLILVSFCFAGCAGSSPVQRFAESKSAFGKNPSLTRRDIAVTQLYRVYEQGATGFVPMGSVRETAEQRARDFCARTGKGYSVMGEQMSQPPYILGNFPRIEIVFACVDKSTSSQSSGVEDEKYTKLIHLKKLLDDGTITKEEFEEQKSKILKEEQ